MNGKDGKPFKTREGGVLRLEDLMSMMREAADKRLSEAGIGADFPAEERSDIANKVGVAALKFADLAFSRFYTDCPILAGDTPADVKASRLTLAQTTLRQLEHGLYILGIEAPDRM